MTKEKSPGHQFFPDKAKAGTIHLSPSAFKAYWMVLWWMWLDGKHHCSMPDTDSAWQRATMIDDSDLLASVRAEIMHPECELLKRRKIDNFLVSFGLRKEARKQAKRRSEAKRAAQARWNKRDTAMPKQCKRNANASFSQSSSSSSSSSSSLRVKKEKSAPPKIAFREYVYLTQPEHDKLVAKYGQLATDKMMEKLNNQKGSTGKAYKSDYRAILNWVVEWWQEKGSELTQTQTAVSPSKYDGIGEEGDAS